MRLLVGYDGSDHAGMAIDDLRWAGLPDNIDAILLSAVEWPATQALRSWGMVETDFSPEWIERIGAAQQLAKAGSDRLQKLFPEWKIQLEPSAGDPANHDSRESKDLVCRFDCGRNAWAFSAWPGSTGQCLLETDPRRAVLGPGCPFEPV